MNETIRNFGYPATLLHEFHFWVVLIRPAQVTAGSLILAAKSEVTKFSALDTAAFAELHRATNRIERALLEEFGAEKINYLMLMMVDPHVHFHVIPRYGSDQSVAGVVIRDAGWPGPPELGTSSPAEGELMNTLRSRLEPYFKT